LCGIEEKLLDIDEMLLPHEDTANSVTIGIDSESYKKICKYLGTDNIEFMGIS
tara:strand:+ start:534 stop:692 length:159 start_codon:yes stop_codon:yes gene_type:complete